MRNSKSDTFSLEEMFTPVAFVVAAHFPRCQYLWVQGAEDASSFPICGVCAHLSGLVGYSLWLQPCKWNSLGRLMSSQVKSVKTNPWQDFQVAVLAAFFSQLPPVLCLLPSRPPPLASCAVFCQLASGLVGFIMHLLCKSQKSQEDMKTHE